LGEFFDEFVPQDFVVSHGDGAFGFSPFDIEEDAGIIAPCAPDLGLAPIHLNLIEGERFGWERL
jgi:hypothetical protein